MLWKQFYWLRHFKNFRNSTNSSHMLNIKLKRNRISPLITYRNARWHDFLSEFFVESNGTWAGLEWNWWTKKSTLFSAIEGIFNIDDIHFFFNPNRKICQNSFHLQIFYCTFFFYEVEVKFPKGTFAFSNNTSTYLLDSY